MRYSDGDPDTDCNAGRRRLNNNSNNHAGRRCVHSHTDSDYDEDLHTQRSRYLGLLIGPLVSDIADLGPEAYKLDVSAPARAFVLVMYYTIMLLSYTRETSFKTILGHKVDQILYMLHECNRGLEDWAASHATALITFRSPQAISFWPFTSSLRILVS